MATTSAHLPDGVFHEISQPTTTMIPQYPDTATRSFQLEITISLHLLTRHHDCLADRFTVSGTRYEDETRLVDFCDLRDQWRATQMMSAWLSRFPSIDPTSRAFQVIVSEIIRCGVEIGTSAAAVRRRVLPLRVRIWSRVTDHEISQEDSMRRALMESETLSNNGRVPADQSSVKKMLKRVRVEDDDEQHEYVTKRRRARGEDCVICCEEIKVGSFASRMPCSHTFHGNCIDKWLQESHYCPLYRFEMPTEEEIF